MYVLVDETGELESTTKDGLGICTLVMINDKSWNKFNKFLLKNEIDPKFQKSSNLKFDKRKIITNYISSN